MGQRFVELASTYTAFTKTGNAVLHVSQLPRNAAILAPGPALIFVVVDGVPSVGKMIMVGSGQIEQQTILEAGDLPPSEVLNVAGSFSDEEFSSAMSSHTFTPILLAGFVLFSLAQTMW